MSGVGWAVPCPLQETRKRAQVRRPAHNLGNLAEIFRWCLKLNIGLILTDAHYCVKQRDIRIRECPHVDFMLELPLIRP
jgi:hypothetical protein